MQKPKGRIGIACAVWVNLMGCLAMRMEAHTLPISFLTLVPDADYLHLELSFNPFELTFYSELDRNHNGRIEPSEWNVAQTNVSRRLLNALKVRVAGQVVTAEIAGVTPDLDSHHVTLRAHYRVDARKTPVTVESSLVALTGGSHVTQVTFGKEGRHQRARLDAQNRIATFEPWEKGGTAVPSHEPSSGRARPPGAPQSLRPAQRSGPTWFMAREQVQKEQGAFHEPETSLTPSLPPLGARVPKLII